MKAWTAVAGVSVLAMLWMGCDATSRYRVLTVFFDGVPTPVPVEPAAEALAAAHSGTLELRRRRFGEHGPYAAKMCNACHESTAANTFVAPREQLCFKCHDLKLNTRYVHGPLASGGCTVCHDPHSSKYRYLLVSESDTFCFHCHDQQTVANIAAHAGTKEQCTTCHDPHKSDKKYLLR